MTDEADAGSPAFAVYFVHAELALALLQDHERESVQMDLEAASEASGLPPQTAMNIVWASVLKRVFEGSAVASLEQRYCSDSFAPDEVVFLTHPFYFKKLDKNRRRFRDRFQIDDSILIEGELSEERLTTSSAKVALSGRARVFMVARVDEVSEGSVATLRVRPIFMAEPLSGVSLDSPSYRDGRRLPYGEIAPQQIDEFRTPLEAVDPRDWDEEAMRRLSEEDVKQRLMELLPPTELHKDWGGELSDLRGDLHVDGKPARAAFLLKGPGSGFEAMDIKHLGKRGDQIVRLYSEPADLLVLQHCHFISSAPRRLMEAFAYDVRNLRAFCVIDGPTTWRILHGAGKV